MTNNYKFGKLTPKIDKRTLLFSNIAKLVELPPIPTTYNVDNFINYNEVDSMLGNDSWGNCVIASRANQTLRFEKVECDKVVPISADDCLNEYWMEQGYTPSTCWLIKLFQSDKPDNGLVMLDAMNHWRKDGWKFGDKKNNYNIYAYATVNRLQHLEVKQGIYLLSGIQAGFRVPQSAMNQFNIGNKWDLTDPIDNNIISGHAIYIIGYNEIGPICVTWGREQQMTWDFWDYYTDEVYVIVDNKDDWINDSRIDVELLDSYLDQITS